MTTKAEFTAASERAELWLRASASIAKFGERKQFEHAKRLFDVLAKDWKKHAGIINSAREQLALLSDGPIQWPEDRGWSAMYKAGVGTVSCWSSAHEAAHGVALMVLDVVSGGHLTERWKVLVIPETEIAKLRERIRRERAKLLAQWPNDEQESDDAFVLIGQLWQRDFDTYRQAKTFLDNHPEIRRQAGQQRLRVHAGDWLRAVAERQSKAEPMEASESWDMPWNKCPYPSRDELPRTIGLNTRRLSAVQPTEVEWLWPNRIPLGTLTLLNGDPDLGKGMIVTDVSARITTGRHFPDCKNPFGKRREVLFVSVEDEDEDTIRPRIDLLKGDPSRVHSLAFVFHEGKENVLNLVLHLDDLDRWLCDQGNQGTSGAQP